VTDGALPQLVLQLTQTAEKLADLERLVSQLGADIGKQAGQTAFREKGHERFSRHDICDAAMLRELPDGYALLVRGGRAPVLAKLPRAWTDRAYKRARRHGHAIYRAPAPSVLTPAREFTLTPPGAPAGAGANGNGHRDAAGFPWGGEDQ